MSTIRITNAAETEQLQPHNANQKHYFECKSQVSTDSFLVLHELAYTLSGFVWSITTFPHVIVLFGLPEILQVQQ